MCGRYSISSESKKLASRFSIDISKIKLHPRYNIAPQQKAPVIYSNPKPTLEMMQWGLIPSWAKDSKKNMINARSETLTVKPSFKNALKFRRCLVPADGYYEWQSISGQRNKQPFRFILKSDEIFSFAGLWSSWTKPDGSNLYNFTIITQAGNAFIQQYHHRMPLILDPVNEDIWLNPSSEESILENILTNPSKQTLEAHKISTFINSPLNDSEECIKPISSLPLL